MSCINTICTYMEGVVIEYICFQKTKSEGHNVSDLFGDTCPTSKWRLCPCYVLSISNKVAVNSF